MLSFLPKTPSDMMSEIKERYKARRKAIGLTQSELSSRSGVSLGSLKRFEHTGQISLESLLKLALVLECLQDFEAICEGREERFESIDEVIQSGGGR